LKLEAIDKIKKKTIIRESVGQGRQGFKGCNTAKQVVAIIKNVLKYGAIPNVIVIITITVQINKKMRN